MAQEFKRGDRVTWRYGPPGGYGYEIPVAGVVEKVCPSRVQIRVARRSRSTGAYQQVTRTVDPARLSPRDNSVAEVDVVERRGSER